MRQRPAPRVSDINPPALCNALGSRARWPVVIGVVVAVVADHLIMADPLRVGVTFALSDAAETLIIAGFIERYFGAEFSLDRLRHVLGVLAAAVVGTCVSGIGGVAASVLLRPPTVPILTIWHHWVASNTIGFIAVAPLLIGLAAAQRQQPRRSELVEGAVALTTLAGMTAVIISLSQERWETVVPVAWLSPMLLWLAARCRPVFAAAGAFIVSITIVCSTVLGIGHFGDPSLPIDDRILGAQASILVVALSAYVLAALFAERRQSEARLARSNALLQRERDNKLLNAQSIVAAIAHEVRQPLTRITTGGNAAQRFLKMVPPQQDKAQTALEGIVNAGHRTSEVIDGFRALFAKSDQRQQLVDINEIIRAVLESMSNELLDHHIEPRFELTSELPHVYGNRSQLQEVVSNLIVNAIEAMETTSGRDRVLRVRTELCDDKAVAVVVEDSGPGINKDKLVSTFTPFATTKGRGKGLGLAISRMIVEHHGGKLTASSDHKGGASFQFVLPVASTDKDSARAEKAIAT
jgi:signal transduction histidine kinase